MTSTVCKHRLARMAGVPLAIALAVSLAAPSFALAASSGDLESELAQAQSDLDNLYHEAEQTGYELQDAQSALDETKAQIEQVEADIEETEAQLAESQEVLAGVISDTYKSGPTDLLSVVLDSTTFEDFVSRIYYANKVSDSRQDAVEEVRDLQTQLDEQRSELEEERAEQEAQVEELSERQAAAEAAAAEAQAYYDQLDAELKDAIAAEQAAQSAAAQEEAQQYEETINSGGTAGGGSNGGSTSGGGGGGTSVAPSGSTQAMVSRAYSVIGSGYSWSGYVWTGSVSSSYFTCSGLVDFALGLPTNSNSPESLYAAVGGRMVYSVDQLNYGDLVFFSYAGRNPGHVGIYIGGGAMIDSCPGGGVQIRSVSFMPFIGGGPIY